MKLLVAVVPLVSLVVAAPAAAQAFEGFRVEGRIAYESVGLEAEYNDALTTLEVDEDEDGFVFGAEAGYDLAVSETVIVGGYAGVDFSDTDFCRAVSVVEDACLEVRRNIYVGARAGAQVGSSTLVFGKAGYSNGQARIDFDDLQDTVDDLVDSDSRSGWHFGLGLEQNFGELVYAKLEYVYTMYGDADFGNVDYDVSLDGDRSQVLGGIGLRF